MAVRKVVQAATELGQDVFGLSFVERLTGLLHALRVAVGRDQLRQVPGAGLLRVALRVLAELGYTWRFGPGAAVRRAGTQQISRQQCERQTKAQAHGFTSRRGLKAESASSQKRFQAW